MTPAAEGDVDVADLWVMVLRAWCGSTLANVCARVGEHCELDPEQIEATVLGLLSGGVVSLPPAVARGVRHALGAPAGPDREDNAMRAELNGQASDSVAGTVGPGEDGAPISDSPPRRNWPFGCEEEGCNRGFDTAQGLRLHHTRVHEGKGGSGWPRRGSGPKPPADPLNQRRANILSAAERSEDPETEALTVCSRQLIRLEEAQVKRVLGYLGQRFLAEGEAS